VPEGAVVFLHGAQARSWEQVITYLRGDAHDRSKVQVLVNGGFHSLVLAEEPGRRPLRKVCAGVINNDYTPIHYPGERPDICADCRPKKKRWWRR
jgi:hypothetical protein